MKPFSETQKKWTLTLGLLIALGFNLSGPVHSQLQSLDLASEGTPEQAKTIQVLDENGDPNDVTIVKVTGTDGKTKTMVGLTAKMQGKSCDSADGECVTDYKVLDVPFDSDILELQAAIIKSTKKAKAKAADDAAANVEEDEYAGMTREEKEEAIKNKREEDRSKKKAKAGEVALKRIDRECGHKRNDKDKAKCFADKFVEVLKSDRYEISEAEALAFFSGNMSEALYSLMSSASLEDSSRLATPSYVALLGSLQRRLPSGYNAVREAVKALALQVATKYVQEAQQIQLASQQKETEATNLMQQAQQANDAGNPALANQLMMQAQQAQQESLQLKNTSVAAMSFVQGKVIPDLARSQALGLQDAMALKKVDHSYANSVIADFNKQAQDIVNRQVLSFSEGLSTVSGIPAGYKDGDQIRIDNANNRGSIFQGTTPITSFGVPNAVQDSNRSYDRALPLDTVNNRGTIN